jgi:cell division protein FtsB
MHKTTGRTIIFPIIKKMHLLKHKKTILLIILSAVIIYFIFGGDTSVLALYRSHKQVQERSQELVRLHASIDSLKIVIGRLKNDSAYIEGLARQKLGMAKPNETVYKFSREAAHK